MTVAVESVIGPYKADNILNFTIRYQQVNSARVERTITRANILNTLFLNQNGGSNNYRVCAAVRVNRIKMITSGLMSTLEWLSAYGPTSATVVSGQSTTAPGVLHQKPPKNSLCSYWSLTGSNESEALFKIQMTQNDIVDVSYSVVLMDNETPTTTTTTGSGTLGQLYRSPLDGPAASGDYNPVGPKYLN